MNKIVTRFLDNINHPLRKEIDFLRVLILDLDEQIDENIKWNGPNYTYLGTDCITMRIQPTKQIQIIIHRGAKRREQPKDKFVLANFSWLTYKENDRAVASFKSLSEILANEIALKNFVGQWILAIKNS